VDAEAAVRSARVTLGGIVESGADTAITIEDAFRADAPLSAYVQWQSLALADGLAAIGKRVDIPLLVHRNGQEIEATATLRALADHAGMLVTHRHGGNVDVQSTVDAARAACGGKTPVDVVFDLCAAAGNPPQALVADMTTTVSADVAGVTIDDYTALTPQIADAVKQAIRYARRSV
jgi:hypothetical protein